jgi:predicted DCC family thiol-disulfide oxidoreductase YuxK
MTQPVLLYDGLCGFCNTTVQFIMGHESRATLNFAALQGTFAAGVIERHPELKRVDSLVWVEGEGEMERVKVRSAAALRVAWYMGGFWRLVVVLWLIPRPLRDFAYDQFAQRRLKFFGRYGSCPVPSKAVRARFLP